MVELVLFSVPSVIYLLVQGSRRRLGPARAAERLGATWGTGRDHLRALALLVPLTALGYGAVALVPDGATGSPGASVAAVTSVWTGVTVLARALGEEILFRGLVGGVLFRRLGFARGNVVQAAVFLLPHLLLLLVDPRLWPVLPVQLVAGLLLGWLRHRSGSVVPGTLVHTVANIGAALVPA